MQSRKVIVLCLIGCIWGYSWAKTSTSRKTLEQKKAKLQKEIKFTQDLLKKTQYTKEASLSDLVTIEKQISLRQSLISNTESEVKNFTSVIKNKIDTLMSLEATLVKLKEEYKRSIYINYKYFRLTDKLLFIVSAQNFGESVRRLNYLRKVGEHRKVQFREIQRIKASLGKGISEVNSKKIEKQTLIHSHKLQKEELNKSITAKNKTIESLRMRETQLAEELNNKKAESKKLDAEIQQAVQKEIQEQKLALQKKQEEEKKKLAENTTTKPTKTTTKTPKSTKTSSTTTTKVSNAPEASDKLSVSFYKNKGKLPWPVEKGFISKSFGTYEHPELNNVIMENNGVDFRSVQGASVRSIFEGKVVSIIANPTFKNAVIINHGEYFSVYTNLENVFVEKGQTVNTKQSIGRAYTDDDNQTEVHLEIWKGESKLNPSSWIVPK